MQKEITVHVLIESTSNQVNQFGGYTGMKPEDFKDFVFKAAEELKFPQEKIILGGDHLGPNPWKDEVSPAGNGKSKNTGGGICKSRVF